MSRSLSILLPVFNAQSYLEHTVLSLLDVVPELTSDFEVLIIDNGSSDDTADTAQSLVARYPQLRLIQNQRRLGAQAAINAGLAVARGDVVFLREDGTRLDLAHIGSLWRRMGRRIGCIFRNSGIRNLPGRIPRFAARRRTRWITIRSTKR